MRYLQHADTRNTFSSYESLSSEGQKSSFLKMRFMRVEAFLFFFKAPSCWHDMKSSVGQFCNLSLEKRWRRRSFEFEPINILPTVHNLASKFYTTYNCPREKHELVLTKLFKLLSVKTFSERWKLPNFLPSNFRLVVFTKNL